MHVGNFIVIASASIQIPFDLPTLSAAIVKDEVTAGWSSSVRLRLRPIQGVFGGGKAMEMGGHPGILPSTSQHYRHRAETIELTTGLSVGKTIAARQPTAENYAEPWFRRRFRSAPGR